MHAKLIVGALTIFEAKYNERMVLAPSQKAANNLLEACRALPVSHLLDSPIHAPNTLKFECAVHRPKIVPTARSIIFIVLVLAHVAVSIGQHIVTIVVPDPFLSLGVGSVQIAEIVFEHHGISLHHQHLLTIRLHQLGQF